MWCFWISAFREWKVWRFSGFKEDNPETPVIIITGYASIESAVETIKHGAFDYITKPFSPEELRVVVKKALKSRAYFLKAFP